MCPFYTVYTVLTLLAALLFAACGPDPQPDDTAAAGEDTISRPASPTRAAEPDGEVPLPRETSPGVPLQELLDRSSDRDEAGRLSVLDALNPPSGITTDTTVNRHIRGQIDTLRSRRYAGLSLTTYHVTGGKELMKSVTVTSDAYQTERGLHVGMPAGELERVLGEPYRFEGPDGLQEPGSSDDGPGEQAGDAGADGGRDDGAAEAAGWPDGTYVFQLEGAMPTFIHADVEGNRVSRLTWNFPID